MQTEMLRFHLKRVVALAITLLLLSLLVIFLLHHRLSDRNYRSDPNIDLELWKALLDPETTRKPTTPPVPHIHVKQLPSLSMNHNWTIQKIEDVFFRYLENKDIRCENDVRLGNWNEGGWNVCLSPPFKFEQPCVVFSFGIGYDWQFDDSVANWYSCRILAFDPSMQEPSMRRSSLIEFRKVGLGPRNEVNKDEWQMKTLAQHLKDEGYWKRPVDYVKIDIEYTEWEVLKQAFQDDSLRYVKQLGFEIHTLEMFRMFQLGRKVAERTAGGDKLEFVHMFETLHQLEILGFKKFNYRKNPFGEYKSNYTKKGRSCCYELHYINTDFLPDNYTIVHARDSKIFHR